MKPLDPKSGYDRYAESYDKHEAYWNSFEQNYLLSYLRAAKGKKVLDAGAGTGRLAVKLRQFGADVTALDISPEMLDILRKKNTAVHAVEGDIEAMPFPDESFDEVFSSLTLVHLQKIEPFLEECYRVLKNDGRLILVNLHFRKPMVLHDDKGKYIIQGFSHQAPHVRKAAEALAFGIEKEIIVTEGDDIWISQILILKK